MTARKWRLGAALALTLAATLWAALQGGDEPANAPPSSRRAAAAAGAGGAPAPAATRVAAPAIALPGLPDEPARQALAAEGANFVAPLSFRAAPPPPPPPSRPAAPPLPFRYIGVIVEDGKRCALVMEGDQLRMLRGGDEIAGRYRVERIDEARIEFVYLPLKQRQSLSLSRS
ncbi:hypothetical protein [Thauera sinica]|uniref:Type II secretion system protein GspC N-terminal domain-containing protein n=1 Tax=Thauera sinica TaxID=2665146 RepID=A0ABW1AN71_9RHOO|nr:hypothetical protein [Thauera sp. K11]ATE60492.1 hypothetical protein CCZ27_11530 [Thauera sp. K11]